MIEILMLIADALILFWLIGTWFFEGHHKKCQVIIDCPHCGKSSEQKCLADHRKD